MSNVNVYFNHSRDAWRLCFSKDKLAFVRECFDRGDYLPEWNFQHEGTDEDICEYAFDVTNNPSRQEEREAVYGRGRSVSVGDVVSVNGTAYLCDNFGWLKV
jgi:hypothetical protein